LSDGKWKNGSEEAVVICHDEGNEEVRRPEVRMEIPKCLSIGDTENLS